ncbi:MULTISPECIES: DUF6776 family protein [Hydrocarboniphaga]|uniref:DUF6776 family protein n=2 Tax=Nevskiaceae TaxID=568386 RepID=UPI002ABB2FEF|nr:DUF6776 family protein [Hydrocarboniphaga sp.]MDZ4079698.1 DUF6776 family protein [Hydrocarboniphaga sp.]
MQHRIVITRHRPWMRAAAVAGAAALLAIAGFMLFAYARTSTVREFKQTRSELEQLRDERRTLARELRTAKSENAELRQQVVYAERSQQIDGQACESVKESLAGLQAEAADLREQIAFYRGVMSPDVGKAGVRVLEMRMTPQAQANLWRYDLVLIQSMRQEKRVAGQTRIAVLGSQGGQQKRLDLSSLLNSGENLPAFAFKYFQEFSGVFTLPKDFRPIRVMVSLVVDGEGSPPVEEEFDWSKIQAQRAEHEIHVE